MNFTLTSKIKIDEETKNFIEEKVRKIDRLTQKVTSVHVIVGKEKFNFPIEILVKGKFIDVRSMAKSPDVRVSFELALGKILSRLSKIKDKIKQHKFPAQDTNRVAVEILDPPKKDEILITDTKEFEIQELTAAEAIDEMEDSEYSFFVFRQASDGALSIVYRRPDNTYGLMKLK